MGERVGNGCFVFVFKGLGIFFNRCEMYLRMELRINVLISIIFSWNTLRWIGKGVIENKTHPVTLGARFLRIEKKTHCTFMLPASIF
jgi:hypothetical protein